MTKIEANLLISLFFTQYQGKLISDIIGRELNGYGKVVDRIKLDEGKLYIITDKDYVLIYYDFERYKIKSLISFELTDDRIVNYINFEDQI